MDPEKPGTEWCCCLGMVGNTNYMCIAKGFDLGHCGEHCSSRPQCLEQQLFHAIPVTLEAENK